MYLIEEKVIYESRRKEYFLFDLIRNNTTQIKLEAYCEILFGRYNYKLQNLLKNTISIESNKIYSAFYQCFDLCIHSLEGDLVDVRKDFFKGYTPYEIQVLECRNEVWVATGGIQSVLCFELDSGKMKQIIGTSYNDKSELSYPESICVFEENVYIPEMGNRQISSINLNNGEKRIYFSFKDPIWDFQKNAYSEIVLLDSGVYEIKSKKLKKLH